MIRLVQGQENTITVEVGSSINLTGYSVQIMFSSTPKIISSISDGGSYAVKFSAADVEAIGAGRLLGAVVVLDGEGKAYQQMYVDVEVVSQEEATRAIGRNVIPIYLAANWVGMAGDGGGGGGDLSDYVKKAAFNGISDPKNSVNSCASTLTTVIHAARGS